MKVGTVHEVVMTCPCCDGVIVAVGTLEEGERAPKRGDLVRCQCGATLEVSDGGLKEWHGTDSRSWQLDLMERLCKGEKAGSV